MQEKKVVVVRVRDWRENGLQEKLNKEMEVCLFLHVPVPTPVLVCACCCRAGPGALAVAAVLGQTKFGSSCAKSK